MELESQVRYGVGGRPRLRPHTRFERPPTQRSSPLSWLPRWDTISLCVPQALSLTSRRCRVYCAL